DACHCNGAAHRPGARSSACQRRRDCAHVRLGCHLLRALFRQGESRGCCPVNQPGRTGLVRFRHAKHDANMTDRPFIPVRIAVLTVSDTRSLDEDRSGQLLAERITEAGHILVDRAIVTDDIEKIRAKVLEWSRTDGVDVVITTGVRDLTGRYGKPEALEPIFEKRMDRFSEVFHRISYDKIDTSTIQSRATGGVVNATFVFVLPGSPDACRD